MQRKCHRGLGTAGGAAQRLKLGIPLDSDSEDDDELPWGPALGDAASSQVVPESDPEEPDVHPDVHPPRKRRRTPVPSHCPDVATPCPDPDVRRPKKRRVGPRTIPDPDAGRKIAFPNVHPPNRSLSPQKVVNPDVKHLAGSNQTLDVESDGDVKVPPKTALFHPNPHRTALEVCGNPDAEERAPNPDVRGTKNRCQMLVVDSDTDVEDIDVLPDIECPKICRKDPNMAHKTGMEMENPHPDVAVPKNGCRTLVDSDTDVETESSSSAVEGPRNRQDMLVVDSDTDVEENGVGPDVGCPQVHQKTQNMSKNQNSKMGSRGADVEGSQNGHQMLLVDSDTDVEENGANPDVGQPKPHQTTQSVSSPEITEVETQHVDVEDSQKGHQMLVVDSDTDVEEDIANPDVGCPESPRRAPRGPDVKTETTVCDVEGRGTLLVESDTDVEEDISHPDVGTPKTHGATQNVPRNPDVEMERPDPPQNKQWTLVLDSDTDVGQNEGNPDVGCKKFHRIVPPKCQDPDVKPKNTNPDVQNAPSECQNLEVDSDTDVEEEDIFVLHSKSHKTPQNTWKNPTLVMETPNPDVGGLSRGWMASSGDSDTDVEENEGNPGVERKKIRRMAKKPCRDPDVGNPPNECQNLEVDTDPDVEEKDLSQHVLHPKSHKTPQNTWKDPTVVMETPNPDVGGLNHDSVVSNGDSDTDVEENEGNPGVERKKIRRMAKKPCRDPDVGTPPNEFQNLEVDTDPDVEEKDLSQHVLHSKSHKTPQNTRKDPTVVMETPNPDVGGLSRDSVVSNGDSDTDVEENEGNPGVERKKIHRMAKKTCRDPDVGNPPNEFQNLEVDTDPDVEEKDLSQHVLHSKSHKTPQNTWKDPTVVMETPNPDVGGLSRDSVASNGDSDTDVEDLDALPNIGAQNPRGTAHEGVDTVAKMATAPDVATKGPTRTKDDPNVRVTFPAPDVGAPKAQWLVLGVDNDIDVEDNVAIPDVGTVQRCQRVSGEPDVVMTPPNPDVPSPTSPQSNGDADMEEVPPTPDVQSLRSQVRFQNRPHPDVVTGSDATRKKMDPKHCKLSPKRQGFPLKSEGDTSVEGMVPNYRDLAPNTDAETPNPDVEPQEGSREPPARGWDPAVPPDVSTPESPHVDPNSVRNDGATPGRDTAAAVTESDTEEDLDLFLEPTQSFLTPAAKGTAPGWDPEEPTQRFFLPKEDEEEEEQPPGDPPDAWLRPPDSCVPPKHLGPQRGSPTGTAPGWDPEEPTQRFLLPREEEEEKKEEEQPPPEPVGSPPDTWDPPRRLGPQRGSPTGTAPGWDPEEPTQRFFLPREEEEEKKEEEQPPPEPVGSPPDTWDPPRRLGPQRGSPTGTAPGWDPEEPTQRFLLPREEEEEKKEEEQPPPEPVGSPPDTWDPPRRLGPQRGSPTGTAPGWDPEEPTQRFLLPREEEEEEEEEQPPRGPPDARVPLAEAVTVTLAQEGAGTPPREEVAEGPRRSQRLARSRGGEAKGGGGGANRAKGGARPDPAPVRRSPRLHAPPPPLTSRGRGQEEPRPASKPRPHRTGHAPPRTQEEEEEPPEVTGHQLRPRGGAGSAPPKVLFTGVVASPDMEGALKTLGGSMATSVFDCTHLVTDRVRRTVKFLCAVARGVPIVTPEWLQKSARSGRVLAPGPFLVRDNQQESHFGFNLAQSLRRARRHPLLQGYEVHVTPSVRPEPEHMKDIVTCSGGTFLPTMPHTYAPRRLVISCEEDAGRWPPALAARLPLASAELLLTGLLRQRLHLPPFLLPPPSDGTPPIPPPPTTPTMRDPPPPPHPPRESPAVPGSPQGSRGVTTRGRNRRPPPEPPRDPPSTRRRPAPPPTR